MSTPLIRTHWLRGTEPGLISPPYLLRCWDAHAAIMVSRVLDRRHTSQSTAFKPRRAHIWGHTAIWGRRQENKTHGGEKLTQDQTHQNSVFPAALAPRGTVCSTQRPCSLGSTHSVCTLGITHSIMPRDTRTCCFLSVFAQI